MYFKCKFLLYIGGRVDMVSVQDLDPTAMDTTAMVSINMYFRYLGAFMLGLSVQNLKEH